MAKQKLRKQNEMLWHETDYFNPPLTIPVSELELADLIQLDEMSGFNAATVYRLSERGAHVWRPYVSTGDFVSTAGVIPYIGIEDFALTHGTVWLLQRKGLK